MNLIETKKLCYTYDGEKNALENIDIKIKRGEVTGIVGANGAGKSTLFLLLNGVLKPSGGEIIYKGECVKHDKKSLINLRKKVGIVFQDPNDQVFLNDVKSDIAFGLQNLGMDSKEIEKRVLKVCDILKLGAIINKPINHLSYGEKKRVAIAGVLAMEPEVIILDEPTASLDPEGVSAILHTLEDIRNKFDISIIISTHDMDIVPLYCSYLYVFDKGRVAMEGKVEEVLKNASNLRAFSLRLPRISHLAEILRDCDGINIGSAATISSARRGIKELVPDSGEYSFKNAKMLRTGFTTGSCAAAAAKSAAVAMLSGEKKTHVDIKLPSGKILNIKIAKCEVINSDYAKSSVIKDSGDDPDVTDKIEIVANVQKIEKGIIIDGGVGIGRVMREGLGLLVGEAAINKTPRKMIESALHEVAAKFAYDGGFKVIIEATDGYEIAKKTFNSRLGVVGGISILGTTGVVEPMSDEALLKTIFLEIDMKVAGGCDTLIFCVGNFSKEFLANKFGIGGESVIKCSNFIGDSLDYAKYKNVKNTLLVGDVAKLAKLAAGITNTHSKYALATQEIFTAHAGLAGADKETMSKIMDAATSEEIDNILEAAKIDEKVYNSLMDKIIYHANLKTETEFIFFLRNKDKYFMSENANNLINKIKNGLE